MLKTEHSAFNRPMNHH